jgi:hypothetical protein
MVRLHENKTIKPALGLISYNLMIVIMLALGYVSFSREANAVEISGPRVALVIGNRDYTDTPLTNPVKDARAMRDQLKRLGFKVVYREDVDHGDMEAAITEFHDQLTAKTVGLFYYSGHGVQADNSNYLIPIGAKIADTVQLKDRAVNVDHVLAAMEEVGNPLNIVILDACRNNPYRAMRGSSAGLAPTAHSPKGSVIAYATQPGHVAQDSGGEDHSIFTAQLLAQIGEPGLTLEQMFKRVIKGVSTATVEGQQPWRRGNVGIEGTDSVLPLAGCLSCPTDSVVDIGFGDLQLCELGTNRIGALQADRRQDNLSLARFDFEVVGRGLRRRSLPSEV